MNRTIALSIFTILGICSLKAQEDFNEDALELFSYLPKNYTVEGEQSNLNGLLGVCFTPSPVFDLTFSCYAGAEGETLSQIETTLNLSDPKPSTLREYALSRNARILRLSGADNGFLSENTFWAQNNYYVSNRFLDALTQDLDTMVHYVDLVNDMPSARASLEEYCQETLGSEINSHTYLPDEARFAHLNLFDLALPWSMDTQPQLIRKGKFFYNSNVIYRSWNWGLAAGSLNVSTINPEVQDPTDPGTTWVPSDNNSNLSTIDPDNSSGEELLFPGGQDVSDMDVPVPTLSEKYDAGYHWANYNVFLDYLNFYQNDDFRLVEIPLGNGDISLLILLPEKILGVDELNDAVDSSQIKAWRSQMESRLIEANIPHFDLFSNITLANRDESTFPINQWGITDLFDPSKSNLSGIYPTEGIYGLHFTQKSTIRLDQAGIHLDASTGLALASPDLSEFPTTGSTSYVSISGTVIVGQIDFWEYVSVDENRPSPIEFSVDHPFIGILIENSTDDIVSIFQVSDVGSQKLDSGDDWFQSSWFGWLNSLVNSHWFYHTEHGWIYSDKIQAGGSWIYDTQLAWLYTAASTYPWLYSPEKGWIYYQRGSTGPRWFYTVNQHEWIAVTQP